MTSVEEHLPCIYNLTAEPISIYRGAKHLEATIPSSGVLRVCGTALAYYRMECRTTDGQTVRASGSWESRVTELDEKSPGYSVLESIIEKCTKGQHATVIVDKNCVDAMRCHLITNIRWPFNDASTTELHVRVLKKIMVVTLPVESFGLVRAPDGKVIGTDKFDIQTW